MGKGRKMTDLEYELWKKKRDRLEDYYRRLMKMNVVSTRKGKKVGFEMREINGEFYYRPARGMGKRTGKYYGWTKFDEK